MIVVVLAASAVWSADAPASRAPVVYVFAGHGQSAETAADSEVVATAIEHFRSMSKADVYAFNRDLPVVTRAVLEKRLSQQLLDQTADPVKALQVAGVLGADYMLSVGGSVSGGKASVSLELRKVSGDGKWTASSESLIAGSTDSAVNRSNAISNAASAAVSQIVIEAFGEEVILGDIPATQPGAVATSPSTAPPAPKPSAESPVQSASQATAPAGPTETAPTRDTTAEFNKLIKEADAYEAKQDLPNAVMALRRAINLEPENTVPRVRLAEMYMTLGMNAEAVDECERALLLKKDDTTVRSMLARLYAADGALGKAAEQVQEIARLEPQNADARITLGDIYWNQGKIEDAQRAYEEAVAISPSAVEPHDRLRRLFTARKMYAPALEHMLQVKLLSSNVGQDGIERYRVMAQVVSDEFNAVLGRLEKARSDYSRERITREDFYQECKDSAARIEALASFLSTQTAPADFRTAHSHGVLAVSLLAQAGGYMVSYLETEKDHYLEEASLLQTEAKTELAIFAKGVAKS